MQFLTRWLKFAPLNVHLKGDFDPKMEENNVKIVYNFTAAKNYISNYSDTPFGPDYWTSSKSFLTASSNQPDLSMYFQNMSNFCFFPKLFNFFKV